MPTKDEKRICCCCGELLPKSNFYKSYSDFYFDGQLPICKKCFARKFKQYASEHLSNKKAMQRMCMAFDIYFNEDLFDSCDSNDETVVGKYFRQLNMTQHKDKTLDDSIKDGFEFSGDRKLVKQKRAAMIDEYGNEIEGEIREKDVEKWGMGFDDVDYKVLNAHYKYLKNSNPNCDANQEIFINDLCYIKMQQMKAAREGNTDTFSKMTESYRKSFTQAGLTTVKDTSALEEFTIGVNAEIIEKYTPAEYYKNKSLYKDHDDIGDYVKRFILRPLRNLMQGTRDRDFEFFVKEEEEDNDFFDDE